MSEVSNLKLNWSRKPEIPFLCNWIIYNATFAPNTPKDTTIVPWLLHEQYKYNKAVTFKPYLKYEFSAPNVRRSYVGDYVDHGFFSTNRQNIELKFKDNEGAKGIYSMRGDSLLVILVEDSKMVFKLLPKIK